ncbi:EamA family transporter RarD [Novosphingobium lentum]|uniref:EamA family transporter RarD n=1 Tax=Novosphingobium lentum TaxID=145287 RepID=UPI00083409BB|nr:EamA family transporter RarD [Novosphingobium lentum]
MDHDAQFRRGLLLGLAAYVIWGFLPLYFHALRDVPPVELVGWRIVATLPLCLVIIARRGQSPDLRAALANRAVLAQLACSALLIGGNWLIYVTAIMHGHVLAASLGYFINPLVNVLLGTVFLGEKLSRRQWLAVAIATAGIALLLGDALDMLAISLSLAVTFALYGLVRKVTPVGSVPGLTIETMVLVLPAIGVVAWFAYAPAGSSMARDPFTAAMLLGTGVLTAIPLLMFAVAARRLNLSLLGFIQFISPTIVFLMGVTVFHEALDPLRTGCFVLIWIAIALFSWDMLARRSRNAAT